MNWYIVQAYSGFEKKVVESIKEELKRHKLESSLDQLLIPTHQVTEVKKGKRTKKEKKFFPGYVLIKIELTKQIYHMIKMGHIHPNAFRNILIIYLSLNPCWIEFVSKNVKFSKVWDFSRNSLKIDFSIKF